jgi:hypothetical protein
MADLLYCAVIYGRSAILRCDLWQICYITLQSMADLLYCNAIYSRSSILRCDLWQIVMCAARLKAGSRPRPGLWRPGRDEPGERLLAAHGSGSQYRKPEAMAWATAFECFFSLNLYSAGCSALRTCAHLVHGYPGIRVVRVHLSVPAPNPYPYAGFTGTAWSTHGLFPCCRHPGCPPPPSPQTRAHGGFIHPFSPPPTHTPSESSVTLTLAPNASAWRVSFFFSCHLFPFSPPTPSLVALDSPTPTLRPEREHNNPLWSTLVVSVCLHLAPLPPYSHHTPYLPSNVPRFSIIPLPFCRLYTRFACKKFKVGTLSRVWAF